MFKFFFKNREIKIIDYLSSRLIKILNFKIYKKILKIVFITFLFDQKTVLPDFIINY